MRRGSRGKKIVCLSVCALLAGTVAGCQKGSRQIAPPEMPVVPVAHVVQREITDYKDFTGRTAAVNSVSIVPRVTGYLVKMPFKEGSEVKKGDLLFVVDPRPYEAQFDQAKAQVVLDQASLDLAKSTLARYQALDKSTPGAVSKQALDQYKAAVVEAEARVEAQVKSLDVYGLNKEFTRIVSPIDGQVSRYYLTLGNLVNQDQTLLTTIVSLDPIYAYFDMDSRTRQEIHNDLVEGKIVRRKSGEDFPILLGLETEDGYPHQGFVNFINNQENSTTGSITMRGEFKNPVPPTPPGDTTGRPLPRLLSPGMFVRIRIPIGQAHLATLIIDRAIQSDQGLKYVYVVDAQNRAQYRRVTTGALQEDGLRVVSGVKPDERVVVSALQQVRPRMEIKPEEGPMPSLRRQAEGTGKE
jgi:multidrug efflux system membrane fusion protein